MSTLKHAGPMDRSTWRLRSGCFSQYFTIGILVSFEAVWMKSNGIGESVIGLIVGGATLLSFGIGVTWARLADRVGSAEGFVRAGFVSFALVIGILPFCRELWHFVVYAFLLSLTLPMIGALMPHLAVKVLGRSGPAGSRFASYRMWGSVGFITATLVVPRLAPDITWIFWTASAVLIAGSFMLTGVERGDGEDADSATAAGPILKLPLTLFLLATTIHTLAVPACFPFLSIYARDLGASTEFIGLLSGSNGIVAVIALPFVGRWVDRFGVRYVLLAAILMQPLRTFSYSLFGDPTGLLIPQLFHVFTFACYEVSGILLISRLVGPGRGAIAQALLLGSRTTGILLGSPLTGFLFETVGPPETYRIVAVLTLLATPVYLPLLRLMGPRGTIAAQTDLRASAGAPGT